MKFFLLIAAFVCSMHSYVFSQGTVTGKLFDSISKKPMGLATVTVFKAADTVMVTYRLSNPGGEFKVPGLPYNVNLRVLVSFSGYAVFRKEFIIHAGEPTVDLGTINMKTSSVSLDEVLVIAERPPVSMRKDTIEFNAAAFKTLPNALVEDLLKKLPGVQVDADGNIMVNGKPVNRILVDGKTFFGDDPKMATRNLPANVIDKVQVMDDKEEMLRNGDDNLANVGKVVNITLKKGVKKGMFGKIYAGAGTQNVFETGAIANIYRDTLQVSVLGYVNNLNRPGFSLSDLLQAGGLQRNRNTSSSNSTNIWNNPGGSGISLNGVNYGGAQNYGGVASSKGIGFNINHAPSSKKSLFLQYFHGNINIDRHNINDLKQFNADTVIDNNTDLTGGVVTNADNIGIGARLKPDSVTNILITANYTIGRQDEDRFSDVQTLNNQYGPLSDGNIVQKNLSNTYYYKHSINITRLSKTKKGRRFNFSHNLDINNKFNDYSTASAIRFLYPTIYDSTSAQLRNERLPSTDANVAFNYSEPLNKQFTFRIGGRYEYSLLYNTVQTFNKNNLTQKYDSLNNALSSRLHRLSNRAMVTPALEIKVNKVSITPSVKALYQYADNNLESLGNPVIQKQTSLLPALQIVYKQLNFGYNKDLVLPGFRYLLPVTNNSNPYFIVKGNSSLVPVESHNFYANMYFNDPKKNLNVGGYINYAITKKDVIQSIAVDDKGVQTSTPVNADGGRNFSTNYNINKQYRKNPKFVFSWNTGAYYSYDHSRLLYNNEKSWQSTYTFNQWAGFNISLNDKFEFNSNYSISYNFTNYSSTVFKKLEVLNHYWFGEIVWRFPKHFVWEAQCRYNFNSSLPDDKDALMLNAAVNFTFLKDDRGVFRISSFDLLEQSRNINVYASKNTQTTNKTNILPRYLLGTFTYNFRPTGAVKKKIGGERLLLF
ncbi:MAG: outer membrane beta-barrel protein [Ferruginibacter sp.]